MLLVICVWKSLALKLKQNQNIQKTLSLNPSRCWKSHRLEIQMKCVDLEAKRQHQWGRTREDKEKHIHRRVSLNVNLKTKAYNCSFPCWCSPLKCFFLCHFTLTLFMRCYAISTSTIITMQYWSFSPWRLNGLREDVVGKIEHNASWTGQGQIAISS